MTLFSLVFLGVYSIGFLRVRFISTLIYKDFNILELRSLSYLSALKIGLKNEIVVRESLRGKPLSPYVYIGTRQPCRKKIRYFLLRNLVSNLAQLLRGKLRQMYWGMELVFPTLARIRIRVVTAN